MVPEGRHIGTSKLKEDTIMMSVGVIMPDTDVLDILEHDYMVLVHKLHELCGRTSHDYDKETMERDRSP